MSDTLKRQLISKQFRKDPTWFNDLELEKDIYKMLKIYRNLQNPEQRDSVLITADPSGIIRVASNTNSNRTVFDSDVRDWEASTSISEELYKKGTNYEARKKKALKRKNGGLIKKALSGLRTAPPAKERYSEGTYIPKNERSSGLNLLGIKHPNSDGSMGFYFGEGVVGKKEGSWPFKKTPSKISKGIVYFKDKDGYIDSDSAAYELPDYYPIFAPKVVGRVAYLSTDPEEFKVLSRRVDEAKSVAK